MKTEIVIERYEEPKVDLFNEKGAFIGVIDNYNELMMVIIQLTKKGLSGYYIMWDKKRIDILDNGSLSSFPKGLYDKFQQLAAELYKVRKDVVS